MNRLPQLKLNLICTYLLSEEWADGRPIELAPPGMLKVDTLVKSTCECTGVEASKEKVMNFQTNGGNLSNAFKSVVQKSSIDSVSEAPSFRQLRALSIIFHRNLGGISARNRPSNYKMQAGAIFCIAGQT